MRVIAPHGLVAYQMALNDDVIARKAAGSHLLSNAHLYAPTRARAQLVAGQVDSRLLIILSILARKLPVHIAAFSDRGPRASKGVPLCSVELSLPNLLAGITGRTYHSRLLEVLHGQRPPYGAASIITTRDDGTLVVAVRFTKPSPIGLLRYELRK